MTENMTETPGRNLEQTVTTGLDSLSNYSQNCALFGLVGGPVGMGIGFYSGSGSMVAIGLGILIGAAFIPSIDRYEKRKYREWGLID